MEVLICDSLAQVVVLILRKTNIIVIHIGLIRPIALACVVLSLVFFMPRQIYVVVSVSMIFLVWLLCDGVYSALHVHRTNRIADRFQIDPAGLVLRICKPVFLGTVPIVAFMPALTLLDVDGFAPDRDQCD